MENSPAASPRAILHVDMDAFFAAVEVLDHPELAGKPVIVGGTPQGRGVVSTASYEARKFGVHSAMPASEAVRRCPHGIFLRPRHERYVEVSRQVFAVFRGISPEVEPLSIDEAFIDVTQDLLAAEPIRRARRSHSAATALAEEVQSQVREVTGGLTCSVGVAPNKFLAKVASDLRKPNGIVEVPVGQEAQFLAPLPIERLWGVGPRTATHLRSVGLRRIGEIAALSRDALEKLLGVELGRHLHRLSHGEDNRAVVRRSGAKSISQERTFAEFIDPDDSEKIRTVLFGMCEGVSRRLRQAGLFAGGVTLKLRDDRFRTRSRSRRLPAATQLAEELLAPVLELLNRSRLAPGRRVRLLGVAASHLQRQPAHQLEFFDKDSEQHESAAAVARLLDTVREKVGDGAITRARFLPPRSRE